MLILPKQKGNDLMWINRPLFGTKYSHLNLPSGNLRFSITSKCNMNCRYCHREGGRVKNELPYVDVLRIIEKIASCGLRKIRLTGGEALLHKDIFKICQKIKTRFPDVALEVTTNGMAIDILLRLINAGYLDLVVVGIDYYDAPVSKNATVGCSSKEILGNILKIKSVGGNVCVTSVFNGDLNNTEQMIDWGIRNNVHYLNILEEITNEVADRPGIAFLNMMNHLADKYCLRFVYNKTKTHYFAILPNNNYINFFHSHCRLRECESCARAFLRVSCDGKITQCLHPDTPEFPLLDEQNFQENFRAALTYLGTPPEKFSRKDLDFDCR